jgi:predicted small secreted protein
MKHTAVVLSSLLLASCASTQPAGVDPTAAQSAADQQLAGAELAAAQLEPVQVDLAQASGPEVYCTKVTRPGTRMVVGEKCETGEQSSVNTQTREEIQREISGQGWSSGWKTADQIAAERRAMMGIP